MSAGVGASKRALVHQLTEMGFDRELAERQVSQQLGAEKAEATPDPVRLTQSIAFPLHLILPWSALISDRSHYAPAARGPDRRPVIILTEAYRAAKEKIKTVVRPKVVGCAPAERPLRLEARVWVPDDRRRDVVNLAKCTHDALEKLVYANDTWLYDVRWIRCGVDVDHPRAELTITPLAP